jgi:hypothetical protein
VVSVVIATEYSSRKFKSFSAFYSASSTQTL